MSDRSIRTAPNLSREHIIAAAEGISHRFVRMHPKCPSNLFTICPELIYEDVLYPDYEIGLEENCHLGGDNNGEQILGAYDPFTNLISLDRVLDDKSSLTSRRRTFTFWHEVGHAILHGTWLRGELTRLRMSGVTDTELSLEPDAESQLERQANLFAGHAAAPTWFLDHVIRDTFRLGSRPLFYSGPAPYCLYVRGKDLRYDVNSFAEFCGLLAYHIRNRFGGLSNDALSIRIGQSKYVVDRSPQPAQRSPFRLHRSAPKPRVSARAIA